MPITQTASSKANVKKSSTNDLPYSPAQPVGASYQAVSTLGQTTIANLGFSVDTTNPQSFLLMIDGRVMSLGSANDFTFAAIASDGTSSAIQLNMTLPANLNIYAVKFSMKREVEFLTDSRFTQLFEAQGNGFQAFVNTANVLSPTTTAGSPGAGYFYSSIPLRASLIDFTQDLRSRIGSDRLVVQQLQFLQTEQGPNAEQVYVAGSDTIGQMRFCGMWQNFNDAYNARPASSANITDFVEITFYGTGLNLLTIANAAIDVRASVDGGAEGSNVFQAVTWSSVLSSRNYADNQILSVASGLTLGVHTVRLRNNSTTYGFNVYGFEIITQSASVITNPGVSYVQGKKLVNSAQSSIAYNAALTGTRGGRVLMYQLAAGGIAQAFTAVNTSSAFMTAADHTNEEMYFAPHVREFGNGRTDDFSVATASGNYTFTLDDGTTTLTGIAVAPNTTSTTYPGQGSGLGFQTAGTTQIALTFVGTGIDLIMGIGGTAATGTNVITVAIDGTQVGGLNSTTTAFNGTIKIASGLPYGTHTVRLSLVTAVSVLLFGYKIYQPKKPTLPVGAVELGDYNVLATAVANTTAGVDTVTSGVIRKNALREFNYLGTWAINAANASYVGGTLVYSSTANAYWQYTFYGTGFDFRFQSYSGNTNAAVLTIDGATPSGVTATAYGGITYSAGTLNMQGSGTVNGCGLVITGLPLGIHTVKLLSPSTSQVTMESFDVITPTYSFKVNSNGNFQNTLLIGSQSASDNRKLTPLKDVTVQRKNIGIANAVTSSPTTTSTSFVPIVDMTVVQANTSGRVLISYNTSSIGSSSSQYITFVLNVDGVNQIITQNAARSYAANTDVAISLTLDLFVSPGTHTYALYWLTGSGTATNYSRSLSVTEI